MKNNLNIKRLQFLKDNFLAITGIVIGIGGGFMYYHFIGCRTGSCPITSSPWLSMLWGAAVGYLVFDMFQKKKQKPEPANDSSEQNNTT